MTSGHYQCLILHDIMLLCSLVATADIANLQDQKVFKEHCEGKYGFRTKYSDPQTITYSVYLHILSRREAQIVRECLGHLDSGDYSRVKNTLQVLSSTIKVSFILISGIELYCLEFHSACHTILVKQYCVIQFPVASLTELTNVLSKNPVIARVISLHHCSHVLIWKVIWLWSFTRYTGVNSLDHDGHSILSLVTRKILHILTPFQDRSQEIYHVTKYRNRVYIACSIFQPVKLMRQSSRMLLGRLCKRASQVWRSVRTSKIVPTTTIHSC